MTATRTARALVFAILVIAVVGVVDAASTDEPDLVTLFAMVFVLALALLARARTGRRALLVRADLARWLQMRSDLTGEPIPQIADRALATYRLQLGDVDDTAATASTEVSPT